MLLMNLAQQEGSEMMQPIAIAIIGGLLTAIVLTLVLIPVIYSVMEGIFCQATVKINDILK